MQMIALVGLGGCLGAIGRYGMSTWAQRTFGSASIAAGTFVVNIIGCLLIGALAAWVERSPSVSPQLRTFLFAGILGSFTTFSTFGLETFTFLREGHFVAACANVLGQVVVGLLAVFAGYALGGRWLAA